MMFRSCWPDDVLQRVERRYGTAEVPGLSARRRDMLCDERVFPVELRADGSGDRLTGYATVYDRPYDVAGGAAVGGWSEVIARGACTKSVRERDPVPLLVNHDASSTFGLPLAATWAGTMRLASDDVGLRVEAELGDDVVSRFLVERLSRGEADAMSFAFRPIRQEWSDDYSERIIREVALVDVSVVTFPANPATTVQLSESQDDLPPLRSGQSLRAARAKAANISL